MMKISRFKPVLWIIATLTAFMAFGCGAGAAPSGSSGNSSSGSSEKVAVAPQQATLQTGSSQQFTATVTGATSSAVAWLVSGVQGGNATVGTISSTGLYTAPDAVPSGGVVSVSARSTVDATKVDSATVTISPVAVAGAPIVEAVSPNTGTTSGGTLITITGTNFQTGATVMVGGATAMNATVSGDTSITAETPIHGAGVADVSVTNPDGLSGDLSSAFTYSDSGSPSGNDYYVATTGHDGSCSGGTQSNPWATINFAATCVSAGATVHVASGTYNGTIDIEVSGTSSARIRFVSDTQWGAQLRSSNSGALTTVELGSYGSGNRGTANYVDFEGFDISGAPPNGIIAYGSHIRVIGNHVHDITVPCNGNGGSGINFQNIYAEGYNMAINNRVHDVKLANPSGCGQTHGSGIYFLNPYGVAYNNISYNNGQTGIQVSHAANVETISNNLIFNNGNAGIWLDCSDSGCVFNDYDTVDNNMVFNNSTLATECGIKINNTSTMGTHNVVNNNIVYGNHGGDVCLNNKGTQTGTLTINPANGTLFVLWSNNGGGDYHLKSGSPAINSASTSCSAQTTSCVPTKDYQGGIRPYGTLPKWDIGPYEYGSPAGTWPWF